MNTHKKVATLILCAFLVLMVGVGCSFENWEYTWAMHNIGDQYDGELSFELLQTTGGFDARMDHASVVFEGALWIFGGYNPQARGDKLNYLADVYKSVDGYNWELITLQAPWKGRRGHQVIVFEDALYLIGGYRVYRESGITYGGAANDVWKSDDGIVWEEIKPNSYKTRVTHPHISTIEDVRGTDLYDPSDDTDWYPRLHHRVVVLDGKMVLVGGFSKEWMPYLNDGQLDETRRYFADMWSSADGIAWTQLDPMSLGGDNEAIFGRYSAGRASFAHFIDNNRLFIVGGTSLFSFQEYSAGFVVPDWDRFWKQTDLGWEAGGPNDKEYIDRRGHQIVFYDDTYWLLPGSKPAAIQWYKGADSIWKIATETGFTITRDGSQRAGSPMYGISNYRAEVFTPSTGVDAGEEAIYVIGGDGDGGVRNNVWRITKKSEVE